MHRGHFRRGHCSGAGVSSAGRTGIALRLRETARPVWRLRLDLDLWLDLWLVLCKLASARLRGHRAASDAGDVFGGGHRRLISTLACRAIVSAVGGTISPVGGGRAGRSGLSARQPPSVGAAGARACGPSAGRRWRHARLCRPAGTRRRHCSSCPRGRNGCRHRRSARSPPRIARRSTFWLIEAMLAGAAILASARSNIEHGVEQQRELLLVQHRGDADAVGHLEDETDEGRLHRSADADRRALFRCRDRALHAQLRVRRRAPARPVREPLRPAGRAARRLQLSGSKSTNSRSPAVMVLMVTLRASDSRIAMPSGSRRAEPT